MSTLNTEVAGHHYGVSQTRDGIRVMVDDKHVVTVTGRADGPPKIERHDVSTSKDLP